MTWRRSVLVGALAALVVASGAAPLFAAGDYWILVAHDGADTVSVIDGVTLTVAHTIAVGRSPRGIAVAPDGRRAYVSTDGAVAVIDLERFAVAERVAIGGRGVGLAVARDGRAVYVGVERDDRDVLQIIDVAGRRIVGSIFIGERPFDVQVSRDGRHVYAVNHDSFSMTVIDVATHAVVREVTVNPLDGGAFDKPHYLAQSPDGRRLYMPFQGKVLVTVDVPAFALATHPQGVGVHQHGIAITPDGRSLVIVNNDHERSTLSRVDTGTLRETHRIAVGSAHEQVVIAPDGRYAFLTGGYFLGGGRDAVTVVDLTEHRVTARIPTGRSPRGLALVAKPRA